MRGGALVWTPIQLTAQAIYVMAINASCAIVIEDQADQAGSANDFACNGVSKKRKASAITDFFCKRPAVRSPSVVI